MKLPSIKSIKSFPGNKVLGKKEKGLGPLQIPCYDCGKGIDIDDTSCPKKLKNLFKRNLKMRGVVMMTLHKMRARCPGCEAKSKDKGVKKSEVRKIIDEAAGKK